MSHGRRALLGALALLCAGSVAAGQGGRVQVAVAANFAAPFARIAAAFQAASGHQVVTVIGSTGKFHTQIRAGAPFDVLLSADARTPRALIDEGLAARGSAYTYARGKLVLWSSQPGLVDAQGAVLQRHDVGRLAVADARLSPYGAAAHAVLQALKLSARWAPNLVQGENIAQTHQFVATGNAALGFVALSQVMGPGRSPTGSMWRVPETLYQPITQDAVLLSRGAGNPAARALLDFLRGETAGAIIQSYGYGR